MGRRRGVNSWTSEADLCSAFIAAAQRSGWDTYPEVGYWDIVLSRPVIQSSHPRPYITVGIQAKLRQSWKLLHQAIRNPSRGPDYRAVLLPSISSDFQTICTALNLGVYSAESAWPAIRQPSWFWNPGQIITLPSITDVGDAGTASPLQLTPWREKALILCRILLLRGHLTGADFDRLRVSRKVWRDMGWIKRAGWVRDGKRRMARYTIGTATNLLPDAKYDEAVRTAVWRAWCAREPWLVELGLDKVGADEG